MLDGSSSIALTDRAVADRAPAPARAGSAASANPRIPLISGLAKGLSAFSAGHANWREKASRWFDGLDPAVDLAEDIGSLHWFRGLATLFVLVLAALALRPDFAPLEVGASMAMDSRIQDELRGQAIAPLALGADSGRQTAASSSVIALKRAPERPRIELVATLDRGEGLGRMLSRAGVGPADRDAALSLVSSAIGLDELTSGTRVDIVLGRRPAPGAPRPLDEMRFRARFDLELALVRGDNGLVLERKQIRVDDTPLRIRAKVDQSLYRSARAAGAPVGAVQDYLKAVGQHIDVDRAIGAGDEFDMIIAYRRAETGERQAGKLLYAGLERGGKPRLQLMRWGKEGNFFEASGVGEQRGGLLSPVPGGITSGYGMRRHPILGYRRMHSGVDFRARYGTPVVAVSEGTVSGAGRMGGCGIAVRLRHGGDLATRYCHLSRLAVRSGQKVRRGQVIGYVGSTGLSTGAHLHYEMYRASRAVDPRSVSMVQRAQLEGRELMEFRASLGRLLHITPGAALAPLAPRAAAEREPRREIERIDSKQKLG